VGRSPESFQNVGLLQLLNSDEFLNWNALCEIRAEKMMMSGAQFLLLSPEREVRFQRSFLCIVAQSEHIEHISSKF